MQPKLLEMKDGRLVRGLHGQGTMMVALNDILDLWSNDGGSRVAASVNANLPSVAKSSPADLSANGFLLVEDKALLRGLGHNGQKKKMRFIEGGKLRSFHLAFESVKGGYIGEYEAWFNQVADQLMGVRICAFDKAIWVNRGDRFRKYGARLKVKERLPAGAGLIDRVFNDLQEGLDGKPIGKDDDVKVTFATFVDGVSMSDRFFAQYPVEMSVGIKDWRFVDVTVDGHMAITLSDGAPLIFPFEAITDYRNRRRPPQQKPDDVRDKSFWEAVEAKAKADRQWRASQVSYGIANRLTEALDSELQGRVAAEAKKLNARMRENQD